MQPVREGWWSNPEDGRQEKGDRRKETGERRQEKGDRREEMGDGRWEMEVLTPDRGNLEPPAIAFSEKPAETEAKQTTTEQSQAKNNGAR
jgi:hypothetical protein